MSGFYVELHRATYIKRNPSGVAYAWGRSKLIEKFTEAGKFLEYVREHRQDLDDVVAFTGSGSLLTSANSIIANELKAAKVAQ